MNGPAWLAVAFAVLMLLVAACCTGRLAMWRLSGRETEVDADGLHVAMGVAMAGMLEPRLSLLPGAVWLAVFASGAAWFGWQAIRRRSLSRPGGTRCAHPAPHAVECIAMLFMLLPAGRAGHASIVGMPGMNGAGGAITRNPALALVLAVFMLGYILWTTDRLAGLSRVTATAAARADRPIAARGQVPRGLAGAERSVALSSPALAPRLAAYYKITMGIAMCYMLLMML